MKSTRRTRGASGGMLLALLALLAWIYLPGNRFKTFSLGQTSDAATIAEALCLGSISRCNSVHLPNATVCALLYDALQSPSTASICSEGSSIPHIIHQSWKKKELPNHFSMWSKSWRDQNPEWDYRFWTDEDNRELVKKHYPWVLETFDAFPHPIMRADTVRYMYMHHFGGVYADLDTWAMRPIQNLTESMRECRGEEAVVAMMSDDVDFEHNIPNAWMASSPGHPFWLFLVQVVQERFKLGLQLEEERNNRKTKSLEKIKEKNEKNGEQSDNDEEVGAEVATGPVVLKEAYDTWQCMLDEEHARMRIMPSGYVFVSDWNDRDAREFFDVVCNDTNIMMPKVQRQCLRAYPNAHVITFWSHSWEVPRWEREEAQHQAKAAAVAKRRRARRAKQQQQQQEEQGEQPGNLEE